MSVCLCVCVCVYPSRGVTYIPISVLHDGLCHPGFSPIFIKKIINCGILCKNPDRTFMCVCVYGVCSQVVLVWS